MNTLLNSASLSLVTVAQRGQACTVANQGVTSQQVFWAQEPKDIPLDSFRPGMQLSASHESASPGMPSRPIAGPVASALSLGEQGGLLVDMLIDGPGSDDGRSTPDKTPEVLRRGALCTTPLKSRMDECDKGDARKPSQRPCFLFGSSQIILSRANSDPAPFYKTGGARLPRPPPAARQFTSLCPSSDSSPCSSAPNSPLLKPRACREISTGPTRVDKPSPLSGETRRREVPMRCVSAGMCSGARPTSR